MERTAIVIIGHGSKDPVSSKECELVAAQFQARHPDFAISVAYVEYSAPLMYEGIQAAAREADRVILLSLFLFAAGHIKNDIASAIIGARKEFPNVTFTASRVLGVQQELSALAYERIASVLPPADELAQTAVMLVGRGSSDRDANGDFCKFVRFVSEDRGWGQTHFSFIGITHPSVPDELACIAKQQPRHLVVFPHLLFAGILTGRLDKIIAEFAIANPDISCRVAPHLGAHEYLLDAMDERLQEAMGGEVVLLCDNCNFRLASEIKGHHHDHTHAHGHRHHHDHSHDHDHAH